MDQGHRSSQGQRGQHAQSHRLRAGADQDALLLMLKRPEHLTDQRSSKLSDLLRSVRADRFPVFVGLSLGRTGRVASWTRVHAHHSLGALAHEASSQDAAQSLRVAAQLVPCHGAAFQPCGGGLPHQSKTERKKILSAFAPITALKSHVVMHFALYPSQRSPTDSAEEAESRIRTEPSVCCYTPRESDEHQDVRP